MKKISPTTFPGRKLRIIVISHAQVIPVFQNRWRRLARDEGYEVHLIVPAHWEQTWFGEKVIYQPEEIHDGSFHVHPLPTSNKSKWGKYLFYSIDAKFRGIKPDIIYVVHEEGIRIHHQVSLYKRLYAPKAKVIFFSMNAKGVPHQRANSRIKRWIHRLLWRDIKNYTDAALVHYPGCLKSLRQGGYDKPIFFQTQVGVDEDLFAPSEDLRKMYRAKAGFEEALVIGYAGRLTPDKGVDDIATVFCELAKRHKDLVLLLVGNGELRDKLEADFKLLGLGDRVCITGFVSQDEVPGYMNAMDLFVLGSKTTPHWIDTFPLVTVQAQAVGLPVIASNSASIPWQLADSAIIYPEGDRGALKDAIMSLYNNPGLRQQYAGKGRERSLANFCHKGMTENFKKIVKQVCAGEYLFHEEDEPYKQWKAY